MQKAKAAEMKCFNIWFYDLNRIMPISIFAVKAAAAAGGDGTVIEEFKPFATIIISRENGTVPRCSGRQAD